MNRADFWNTNNISTFKQYDVLDGKVSLSNSEYADHLTEVYGTITVCGQRFDSGDLFEEADPTAFRCGKNDLESEIQSELESQIENEDSSDIEFIDGDEYDEFEDDE